jgi:drug/metabolite transporter (DMT)-like permease
MRLILLTSLTMLAFAANSLLTRIAIDQMGAEPLGFALIRTLAGAAMLVCLVTIRSHKIRWKPFFASASPLGAISLAVYMAGFSFAYREMDAGLGALVLFGVVQVTMLGAAALRGDALGLRQGFGAALAFAGLLLVLWPSGASGGWASAAMVAAGVGWAAYSISGRHARDSLLVTAANFIWCLPLVALTHLSQGLGHGLGFGLNYSAGALGLGILCGAVTSGLGYALWYHVLPQIRQSSAAIVQLSVPIIAVLAGSVLLREPITFAILAGGAMVLLGIAIAVTAQTRARARQSAAQ